LTLITIAKILIRKTFWRNYETNFPHRTEWNRGDALSINNLKTQRYPANPSMAAFPSA